MKLIHIFVATSVSLALAACGGGGGGGDAPSASTLANSGTQASGFDSTEFQGNWIRLDAATCFGGPSGFAYGPYYFKNDRFTLTGTTAEFVETLYNDAACTSKAGKLTENYAATYTAGSVAGKTNPARVQLTYTGSVTGADGGTGVTLTKLPDGSQTGGNVKALLDVENAQLFTNSRNAPLDADGYPNTLNASATYKR